MQKLLMPFQSQMMLCGYKNPNYRKHWGYDHYGVDISTIQGGAGSNHNIYASGAGQVVAYGFDNSGGNVIVVIYPDACNHYTKKSCDLVARYMHLASITAKKGQAVRVGDVLGAEGKTQTGDYHLHIEFDTDTKWSCYSPQVSSKDDTQSAAQGNILMKGTDSVVNPSHIFHLGDNQKIVPSTYNPTWLNPEDKSIPSLPAEDGDTLRRRIAVLETEVSTERAARQGAEQRAEKAVSSNTELIAAIQAAINTFSK